VFFPFPQFLKAPFRYQRVGFLTANFEMSGFAVSVLFLSFPSTASREEEESYTFWARPPLLRLLLPRSFFRLGILRLRNGAFFDICLELLTFSRTPSVLISCEGLAGCGGVFFPCAFPDWIPSLTPFPALFPLSGLDIDNRWSSAPDFFPASVFVCLCPATSFFSAFPFCDFLVSFTPPLRRIHRWGCFFLLRALFVFFLSQFLPFALLQRPLPRSS